MGRARSPRREERTRSPRRPRREERTRRARSPRRAARARRARSPRSLEERPKRPRRETADPAPSDSMKVPENTDARPTATVTEPELALNGSGAKANPDLPRRDLRRVKRSLRSPRRAARARRARSPRRERTRRSLEERPKRPRRETADPAPSDSMKVPENTDARLTATVTEPELVLNGSGAKANPDLPRRDLRR